VTDTPTLFELLAADRRRQVLLLLAETDSLRVPDGLLTRSRVLAEGSTGGASGGPALPEDGAPKGLEVQLFHEHLPKLEEEGLIEWDREAGTVSRGPAFGSVRAALELVADNRDAFPTDPL
jgi:hypothetical protein